MPYRKSAANLEEMCLDTVTNNFGEIKHKLASQPSMFTNMIYKRVCQTGRWSLPHKIFIHSGTDSLQSLHRFDLPMDLLLDKIVSVCKNLVVLRLHLLDLGIYSQSLFKLFQNLPRLQHLSLHGVKCTDQILSAIGQNCPQLMHLSCADCVAVTNAGVSSLGGCTKLTFLDAGSCGLSVQVCLFILDQLPRLKVFKNQCWHELYRLLKQRSSTTLRTYLLEEMPHVITFVTEHDIMFLNASFPNLRSLSVCSSLGNVGWVSAMSSINVNLTQRLTSLSLICSTANANILTELQLKMILLKCENLETLCVRNCRTFSDDLVEELVQLNSFRQLRVFNLYRCDSVSLRSILRLLEMRNPLKELKLCYCARIVSSACVTMESYVKKHNLDIEMWYSNV